MEYITFFISLFSFTTSAIALVHAKYSEEISRRTEERYRIDKQREFDKKMEQKKREMEERIASRKLLFEIMNDSEKNSDDNGSDDTDNGNNNTCYS